jgi:hypothetical protein
MQFEMASSLQRRTVIAIPHGLHALQVEISSAFPVRQTDCGLGRANVRRAKCRLASAKAANARTVFFLSPRYRTLAKPHSVSTT